MLILFTNCIFEYKYVNEQKSKHYIMYEHVNELNNAKIFCIFFSFPSIFLFVFPAFRVFTYLTSYDYFMNNLKTVIKKSSGTGKLIALSIFS